MKREEEIFEQAHALSSPEARADYLLGACGNDLELRRRIDALLDAHRDAGQLEFFNAGEETGKVDPLASEDRLTEQPGDHIGRYRLLQKIGEGGMGVVYMAEQEEPVRRRVALKIIRLGMDTKSVVARFEAERQALAMMDHPNIAKVLDGGATEAGRPYFVMELVRGVKITEYCDEARLSTRERLDLFIKACQAIQHAHQKGVIHRDIKPSNILVTINDGVATPKVIDFGIAKATQGRLTDKTLFTQFEALIGTPAYMSPEQAAMTSLDIDTRSDIYSLGVLLYELLAGSTPFDAKELLSSGLDAMRRTIREKEPVRPSTRLATLRGDASTTTAQRRSSDSSRLMGQLRGDLDWIVMKCLEKDRARRYETANGLAADLRRHLGNEPVLARPPSASYRLQKLARRNKLAFAAASAATLMLIAGLSVLTWAFLGEAAQRRTAVEARKAAETAQANEATRRKLADMQLALQAWEEGDLQRARELINASRPAAGEAPGFEWRHLRNLCRDESQETIGGPDRPFRAAMFFSHDALLLNEEKTLTLHDISNGRNRPLLEDRDGIWNPTLCAGDTNLLATSTDDGRIKVWDIAAGNPRVEFEGHPRSSIHTITFSGDGKWLASTSGDFSHNSDNTVKLWDVEADGRRPARILHRYSIGAYAAVFSPDGRQLFTGGNETRIRAWDVLTGKEAPPALEGHTGWVHQLITSPDGLWMASGCGDGTAMAWNLGSRQPVRKFLGHLAGLGALAVAPGGRILASGADDHTIRLWDVDTGRQLSLLRGHGAQVNGLSFSPDGRWLASRGNDGQVKLWPSAPGLEVNTLNGSPEWLQEVALSPDGRNLAAVAINSFAVNLWDLPTRSLSILTGHTGTMMAAAFSPDGRILATGSHDRTVRLWDVAEHRTVSILTNSFPVGSLAFLPDGQTLAVGGSSWYFLEGDEAGLQFWDVPSGRPIGSIPGDASDIVEIALSTNGAVLAAGHKDGAVSLWDARSRQLILRFASQFGSQVISLAFSPTQPLLAASDSEGNIVLYDTSTREVVRPPLKAHTFRVMSMAFSPDGRTLASAGEGGGLKLWNMATRQVALTLKGHVGAVCGIAFSRDGNLLASCGADATVRLWRAPILGETDVVQEAVDRGQR